MLFRAVGKAVESINGNAVKMMLCAFLSPKPVDDARGEILLQGEDEAGQKITACFAL
ncbi:MAG: hypothetical protein WAU53_14790 [Rhodoplanes sp.]